jgi:hypothetical protein
MATLSEEWKSAKKDFEALTGKKKPKPEGLFAKTFNHSGLTGDLKTADEWLEKIQTETDPAKRRKLIPGAKKHELVLTKSATSYIDLLDKAATTEVRDNGGDKTTYARGLKVLRDELKRLDKQFQAKNDQWEVALDTNLQPQQKAAAMMHKSLAVCVANAAVVVKKIKATPTLAEFNNHFGPGVTDTAGRKMQVQLLAAAAGRKRGELTFKSVVDPQSIADDLTPWQAGGKNKCVLPATAGSDVVLKRTEEFLALVKLAARFLDDLDQ